MGSAIPCFLREVSASKTTGVTNGSACSFIGEELKHVSFPLDVHSCIFKQIVLTDELGIRELVNGIGSDKTGSALDRDDPATVQQFSLSLQNDIGAFLDSKVPRPC